MAGRFEKKRPAPVWKVSLVLVMVLLCIGAVCFAAGSKAGSGKTATGSEQVQLRLESKTLVQVTDVRHVREIKELLGGAEDIGYVPKTYILGPQLVYIGMDGQAVSVELDLDSDLFRFDGRFFDYGPGNDNNAMPRLWELLGVTDWPEEVKTAYPEWFASLGENTVPTNGVYQRQSVYMDLWYPDWYYVKIREDHAQAILEAMRQENPVSADREMVAVEDSVYTIHIAYDDGREYDLACVGEEEFLLWESGSDIVYGFSSSVFRKTADENIALSKEQSE